jgi:hypothetical protein
MADKMSDPKVIQGMKDYAKYIAIVVRNAMEDFHCKHLSNEQMKELNPIVRNAIYTAIYAYETHRQSDPSKRFVEYHLMSIPKYWEEPELLGGLKE